MLPHNIAGCASDETGTRESSGGGDDGSGVGVARNEEVTRTLTHTLETLPVLLDPNPFELLVLSAARLGCTGAAGQLRHALPERGEVDGISVAATFLVQLEQLIEALRLDQQPVEHLGLVCAWIGSRGALLLPQGHIGVSPGSRGDGEPRTCGRQHKQRRMGARGHQPGRRGSMHPCRSHRVFFDDAVVKSRKRISPRQWKPARLLPPRFRFSALFCTFGLVLITNKRKFVAC